MFKGSEYAYYAMYLVGFAIMMVVNLKTYKKYELKKSSAVILTLITYVAGVTGALIMGDIHTAVHARFETTSSNVAIFGAVLFTPMFMTVAALLFGKSWRKVMDLLAPGIFIILTCAKFGCFMAGCCAGRESSFLGVYNPRLELTVFPSQLFESITMLAVVGFCFWYAFKFKGYKSGTVYPVVASVYSVTRFFWEFMRYYAYEEMRHIMFGLSFWQFMCITVIVLSAVWLAILRIPKLAAAEEKYYIGYAEKLNKFKTRNEKNIVHHKKKKK